jgi:HSP20 family protein
VEDEGRDLEMSALMPRLFGDLTDWFDAELPLLPTRMMHMIRVEDRLTDSEYLLRAELPGVNPEKDVQVSVSNGVLTIHAEKREEEHGAGRTEFRYGSLHRSVRLPANADEAEVTARYTDGILEIAVPLSTAEPVGRAIPVVRTDS